MSLSMIESEMELKSLRKNFATMKPSSCEECKKVYDNGNFKSQGGNNGLTFACPQCKK